MPVTTADLFNRALDLLGAQSIQSITDSSNEAITCARNWDQSRRVVLRLHPWNFAITRASLTIGSTTPAFDWLYTFPLPALYLRLTLVDDCTVDDWRFEGGNILCNATTLKIAYVQDVSDPALWDPLAFEAIAHHLAWVTCFKITQSSTLKDQLMKDLTIALRQARFVDSTEDPKQDLDIDVWMRSRLGPASGFIRDPMT